MLSVITCDDYRFVDLRQLETFVTVAEERSFSRAASRLHVVQSAVSATIRRLEAEWQAQLFDRTTHRVALTDFGRVMLPEARQALAAAEAVEHAVEEARGGLRGTVRVGIMQSARRPGGVNVAAAISAFKARYPGVAVEVRQGGSARQAEAVRAGDLDLAFIGLPDQRLAGLHLTRLADVEMLLACHPGHRLAARAGVELEALVDEPFADLPPEWGVRVAADRAFAAAGVERTIAYEINDLSTLVAFVSHGLAVALLPPLMAAPGDAVAFVPIRRHTPRFVMSIVTPADRWSSPAARAFAEIAAATATSPTA